MNEQTIEVNGQTYHYDPEYDCYYRRYTRAELGYWDLYGWIYAIVILTAICASITYLH